MRSHGTSDNRKRSTFRVRPWWLLSTAAILVAALYTGYRTLPFDVRYDLTHHEKIDPLSDPLYLTLRPRDQERDLRSDLFILANTTDPARPRSTGLKLYRGDPDRKWIALTFDDGPHPKYVPTLLKILKKGHAKATFFVIGSLAERYPDTVRAEAAAGCEVSNHTFHHARLNQVMPEMAAPEIEACDVALEKILGRPADKYFRPPGGEISGHVIEVCRQLGKTPVMYSDDPEDFKNIGEKRLLNRLLTKAAPGGIILLHDNVKQTLHILPDLLHTLHKQGYEFVTVAQLDAARQQTTDSRFVLHTASLMEGLRQRLGLLDAAEQETLRVAAQQAKGLARPVVKGAAALGLSPSGGRRQVARVVVRIHQPATR